jgi:hypothetical protein
MKDVAVYTFEVWDRQKGANVIAPRMATAETIRRVKGMADLESKQLVDESKLDPEGYYPAPEHQIPASGGTRT